MKSPTRMYVLGEAKSALVVKSGQSHNLRVAFEKLLRGIRQLNDQGAQAIGYFLVMSEQAAQRVSGWCEREGDGAPIEVLEAELTREVREALEQEKKINDSGRRSGNPRDSQAPLGQAIGEEELERQIRVLHPRVRKCPVPPPLREDFDYFGVIERR